MKSSINMQMIFYYPLIHVCNATMLPWHGTPSHQQIIQRPSSSAYVTGGDDDGVGNVGTPTHTTRAFHCCPPP
jgi:hypothetical protein